MGCSICTQTHCKCRRIHNSGIYVAHSGASVCAAQSNYVRGNECTRTRCRWCAIYIQSGLFLFFGSDGAVHCTRTSKAKIAFPAIPKSLEPFLDITSSNSRASNKFARTHTHKNLNEKNDAYRQFFTRRFTSERVVGTKALDLVFGAMHDAREYLSTDYVFISMFEHGKLGTGLGTKTICPQSICFSWKNPNKLHPNILKCSKPDHGWRRAKAKSYECAEPLSQHDCRVKCSAR